MTQPKVKTNPFTGQGTRPQTTSAAETMLNKPTTPSVQDPTRTQLRPGQNTYGTAPRPGGGQGLEGYSTDMGMGGGQSSLREVGGAGRTVTTYDQPQAQTGVGVLPNAQPSNGGWNLPSWNPNVPAPSTPSGGAPATQWGGEKGFFGGDPNIFNPEAYKDNDAMTPNYISSALPVAQFLQNNAQYRSDFNEAQRRYNQDYAAQQQQNQYQQQLSTRQQQAAEMQAQLAAQQWEQQFGWQQQTDQWNRDLSQQSINNQYAQGMDQNQATRDVANTYANSNMYQANQQLAGTKYASDADLRAAMYGADQSLAQAGLYSDAQRYQAQLGLQGQLGSAQLYSGAQRYEADQGLAQAELYSQAQRYGSDQQLQGQLGSANIYSGAQRYESDTQKAIAAQQNAFLYAQLQQQAQQAAQERANQLAMANLNAYGRSVPVQANWARSWG